MLPSEIARHFAGRKNLGSGILAHDGLVEEGSAFHSPKPLLLHHTPIYDPSWPSAEPEERIPTVLLSGTNRDSLIVWQTLLYEMEGVVPWEIRREIGNVIRAIGEQGWRRYREVRGG